MKTVAFITENFHRYDGKSLLDYEGLGGFSGLKRALAMEPLEVCAEILASGLQGRGGAAYSTGVKWKQANSVKGDDKVVICNADEGEPCTFKDREVILRDPFRLIEGMIIAGHAVGAKKGFIYMREEYEHLRGNLLSALKACREAGYLDPDCLRAQFDIELYSGAGAYVCGEGSTLIESMEGKSGRPRIKPPYIKECGLFLKPTCINNVETLAAATAIMQHGHGAFTCYGTEKSTGTKLISVGGNVVRPGVYEIPFGITLEEILNDVAGGVTPGQTLQLLQLGGASGRVAPPSALKTPYTYEDFSKAGLDVGSGGFLVVDQRTDVLTFLRYIQDFFSHECCGKCTPCREGNKLIDGLLDRMIEGRGDVATAKRFAEIMSQCAFCGLGEMAQSAFLSSLKHFPEAFEQNGSRSGENEVRNEANESHNKVNESHNIKKGGC